MPGCVYLQVMDRRVVFWASDGSAGLDYDYLKKFCVISGLFACGWSESNAKWFLC